MASINYDTVVSWDATLADVGYADADNGSLLKGLAICALKTTTGAPATVAGHWLKGAIIQNIIDGTFYIMTGTTASPAWTQFSALSPASNSITTAMLQAASVTLAKLASGIAPSHVVKFAGTASGGTTATRAYTVTGALAGDVATAVIRASTNAASIQKATLSTDTLTVLFSTDPGAGTTVDYSVLRAAA